MRSDVLQAFSICAYGNRALLAGLVGFEEFGEDHTAFRTTGSLRFDRVSNTPLGSGPVAEFILPWLRRLTSEDVAELRLNLEGCSLSNVNNTERGWGILTDGDRGTELWNPVWRSRWQGQGATRPHQVVYTGERCPRWTPRSDRPFGTLSDELHRTADEMAVQLVGELGSILRKSVAQAAKSTGELDLLPPESTPAAQRALRTAIAVCVALTSPVWMSASRESREVESAAKALWGQTMILLESTANSEISDVALLAASAKHPSESPATASR
jgi:hypothetical protein